MNKRKLIVFSIYMFALSAFCIAMITPFHEAVASTAPKPSVTKVTLYTGYKNYKIKLENLKSDATVTYRSANKKIATVTRTGTIKPVSKGTTTVTVTIKQSKKTYQSSIKVTVKKPSVQITQSVKTISAGSRFTFQGKSIGIKNANLVWYSSNYTIAQMNGYTGRMTAIKPGKVTITLKDLNTGKKKECEVTVIKAKDITGILTKADARRTAILNSPTNITCTGNTYYVSNSGDDSNNGLSEKTAWATLDKVNSHPLKPGDAVLFKRGDFWRGALIAKKGVTYSAWGKGDKPKIFGSPENGADPKKWRLLEGTDNIWVFYRDITDCGTLVFNNDESCAIKEIPSYVNGRFVLSDDNNVPFDVKKHLDHDLEFFSKADSYLTNGVPYIPGMEEVMDVVGKLYLRCDKGNPGEVFDSIEFLTRGYIITPSFDCTFDNLCLKYGGSHAIFCWGMQLTVRNCEIGWIGGCVQYYNSKTGKVVRFGNGVEASGDFAKYEVTDCYVYQVYDAALSNQDTDLNGTYSSVAANIVYSGNLIEYSTYGLEIFLNTRNPDIIDHYMKNLSVDDNIILYTGYGWGNQRYDIYTPSCIQMWDSANPAENFVISNNIFYLSSNFLIRCGARQQWKPLLSGNTYVQYSDALLGRWRPADDAESVVYQFSDESLEQIIKKIFGDMSPKIIKVSE